MRTDPPALLGGDTLELLLAGAAGVVQHQEFHTRALRAFKDVDVHDFLG
jgi:hypothetical protein